MTSKTQSWILQKTHTHTHTHRHTHTHTHTHTLSASTIKARRVGSHGIRNDEGDTGWIQRRFFKSGDHFI